MQNEKKERKATVKGKSKIKNKEKKERKAIVKRKREMQNKEKKVGP